MSRKEHIVLLHSFLWDNCIIFYLCLIKCPGTSILFLVKYLDSTKSCPQWLFCERRELMAAFCSRTWSSVLAIVFQVVSNYGLDGRREM